MFLIDLNLRLKKKTKGINASILMPDEIWINIIRVANTTHLHNEARVGQVIGSNDTLI